MGVDYDNMASEYGMILADGTALIFYWYDNPENIKGYWGNIKVDVDGFKGEHTWGKDTFVIIPSEHGLVPGGMAEHEQLENFNGKFSTLCNRKFQLSDNGGGCTAWVIYNENIDYLHCDDLSWDGKKKCK